MHHLLPEAKEIRVIQHVGRIDTKALASVDQLLLLLPQPVPAGVWKSLPHGSKMQPLLRAAPAGSVPAFQTRLGNKRQTMVVAGTTKDDASTFEQLSLARRLVTAATTAKAGCLGIAVQGFEPALQATLTQILVAAALAAGFQLPAFKSSPPPPKINSIRVVGLNSKIDLGRVRAEANGNNLARWLTALPPNKLDAAGYSDMLRELAQDRGWSYKRFATRELEKLGAGAFLAVAQGNDDDSAAIIRLRYRPGPKNAKGDLSLVGKGIIFDTGGTNLKPFKSMLDMHGDMQGSAVALGILLAISELKLPMAVDCWLAITENRTGPNAYKSQDIVTAANGKTIQTIHTDAEGRMALADTLVLASRDKPGMIVDYATLTGSCVNAITTRYCGVFTNRAEWHPRLKRTGQFCGERVWPFPIGKEFLEDLKSDVADLQQCSVNGTGDHILAGSFLAEFVENDTPWIHVDLSASNHSGGLGHIPTEITGFGVRYTMSLILDEKILEATRECSGHEAGRATL
ncbi:MAG: leucyl aminopeptidase family protein [Proteobacteria bacterium]|nr:leucyl aminopeptidase family protein [Pseudomonadota bacterium]